MPLFGRPTAGALAGGGGSGTVTSVALTVPGELAVAGSPITTAGTLAVTRVNQNANLVMAGPATGAAATPGYRALVAADLPAGTGTVTSVALTVPNILSVTGSPITAAGTLAVALAAQTQAQVFASPGGSSGVPAFRALLQAHLASAGATAGAIGAVQLAGDLGGTASAPTVVGVNGAALPVGVASGGSGLATLSTYALLAGGTTATGALQQVSGLGTSGQVLTSNGAAALPTWQAAAGGANTALSNLASVAINAPLATGAGTVFAGSTTAAAATASTTAGVGLTLTADAAVAGTTNAGAAQGGDVTITAGPAARLTSGSARGGAIFLIPGAGIGTGAAGGIGMWGTTSSFPGFKQRVGQAQLQITDAAWTGRQTLWIGAMGVGGTIDNYSANDAYLTQTGNSGCSIRASSGNGIGWTSGGDATQSPDTQVSRKAAGSVSLDTTTRANGLGRLSQRTSTAANATTTEYPSDKDWGIHQNTTTGAILLSYNNAGTIVSVQLS